MDLVAYMVWFRGYGGVEFFSVWDKWEDAEEERKQLSECKSSWDGTFEIASLDKGEFYE